MTFIYKLIYLFSFYFTLFSLKSEVPEAFKYEDFYLLTWQKSWHLKKIIEYGWTERGL